MATEPTNVNQENSKFISMGTIMARYNRDYKEYPIDVYDAIEWAAEAARDVGEATELRPNLVDIPMENMIAKAPCGIYRINSVKRKGCSDCYVPYDYDGVFIRPFQPTGLTWLTLDYEGLPVDENGMPIFLKAQARAITQYLYISGHGRPRWLREDISDTKWQLLWNEYERSCGDARGSFDNFNKQEREECVRIWQNLIPQYKLNRPFQEGVLEKYLVDGKTV
jgi:hypothetical protein